MWNTSSCFPRRASRGGFPGPRSPGADERWVYVAIDYGNSAWAFRATDGTPDVLASRDYRVILGIERKIVGGLSHELEIGYVFNRDIKIASISGNDISMDDTLIAAGRRSAY